MINLIEKNGTSFLSITAILVLIKIRDLRLNLTMEIYSVFFFLKNKDYYMTSISSYVDLTVDVKKLPQFDKIKENLDLANAILVLVCFLVIKKRYRNHVWWRELCIYFIYFYLLFI